MSNEAIGREAVTIVDKIQVVLVGSNTVATFLAPDIVINVAESW